MVATARSKALAFLLENDFEIGGIASFTKRETSVAVALGWQLVLEVGVVDWVFELVVWGGVWGLGFGSWIRVQFEFGACAPESVANGGWILR